MTDTFLTIEHVRKSYGANTVVQDFNMTVERGEFISFLGPSGCGKTTVLRMVAGFEEPTSGKIVISGKDVTRLKPNQRNIGMVFQAYALFPNMTVAQNIGFGLKVAGKSKAEIDKRVGEMLELISLPTFGDRYPYQLSGGQQQRIALARAIVFEPEVLLLDEPLSALDANMREAMRVEIKKIQKQTGITAIFVTHDQEEALSMSDRIVVMNAGKAEQVGTPFEIYNRPSTKFVANFVGTLNVLEGTVTDASEGRVKVGAGEVVMRGKLNGSQTGDTLSLALRPEAISLGRQPGPRRHARRRDFRSQLPRLRHPGSRRPGQGRGIARHLQFPRHAAAESRRKGRDQLLAGRRIGAALTTAGSRRG
jgi:putative spermidine/putrescine transport system ATP-binding protein